MNARVFVCSSDSPNSVGVIGNITGALAHEWTPAIPIAIDPLCLYLSNVQDAAPSMTSVLFVEKSK